MSGAGDRFGEFELIARVFQPLAGAGGLQLLDDAAVFSPPPGHDLVVTKDMLAAGIHFFADDPFDLIAKKALRVNLSDLAAKGAKPLGYLLGLGLPAAWTNDQLMALGRGLAEDQAEFGIELWGGDTIRSPGGLTLSITAIGSVPHSRMVTRSGARPGDIIIISGVIGDSALGLKLRIDPGLADRAGLTADERDYLLRRYLLPAPRTALAGLLRDHASAAMDLSDGLVGDVAKLARASGVGLAIDLDKVAFSPAAQKLIAFDPAFRDIAVTGGDDYEIAAAVSPENWAKLLKVKGSVDCCLTAIGVVLEGGVLRIEAGGSDWSHTGGASFTHF